MKRSTTKALSDAVDLILWEQWDPIGVNDNPAARDEYRNYIQSVVTLLQNGADSYKLAQHLHSLEAASMGIETGGEHRTRVAQLLLEEYQRFS